MEEKDREQARMYAAMLDEIHSNVNYFCSDRDSNAIEAIVKFLYRISRNNTKGE